MSVKREIDFYSELMEQGQGNELAKAFPKVIQITMLELDRKYHVRNLLEHSHDAHDKK